MLAAGLKPQRRNVRVRNPGALWDITGGDVPGKESQRLNRYFCRVTGYSVYRAERLELELGLASADQSRTVHLHAC